MVVLCAYSMSGSDVQAVQICVRRANSPPQPAGLQPEAKHLNAVVPWPALIGPPVPGDELSQWELDV